MFYIIKDEKLQIFDDNKEKLEITLEFMPQLQNERLLETDIITADELNQHPNRVLVDDIQIEIDVPDYEEQEITKEIEVPDFETVTKTEEIQVGEDEDGNPIYETREWQEEVQTGTHFEIVTETQTIQVGSHKETITVKGLVLNPDYEDEKAKEREEQFNKDFFNTSLGYIRRKVSMATGETKDFLSDLLPTISMGVQMGQPIQIISYDKPDFTQEIPDWTVLQNVQTVTAGFVQECFMQLSNDFKPVNNEGTNANSTDTTE